MAVAVVVVFSFRSWCTGEGPSTDSWANPKLKATCLYLVLSGVLPITTGPVRDHSMRLLIFCTVVPAYKHLKFSLVISWFYWEQLPWRYFLHLQGILNICPTYPGLNSQDGLLAQGQCEGVSGQLTKNVTFVEIKPTFFLCLENIWFLEMCYTSL